MNYRFKPNALSSPFYPFIIILFLTLLSPHFLHAGWKFIVYGDTQDYSEIHRQVLKAMATYSSDYRFIMHVGDVTEDGRIQEKWDAWKSDLEEVLGSTGQDSDPLLYMAARGNHDKTEYTEGLENWKTYLWGQTQKYGNNGLFFSFDYENARFVVMCSKNGTFEDYQKTMMLNAIQNNPKTWLFLFWHHPIFSFGGHRHRQDIMDAWGFSLYQNGCDIIFNGHLHYYTRTHKVVLDGTLVQPDTDSENGVTQIITGTGSGSLIDINPDAYGNASILASGIKDYGYTEVEINGDKARIRFINRNGNIRDQADIYANNKPSNDPPAVVNVTLQTEPPQLYAIVNENSFKTPQTFQWNVNDIYYLSVPSPQNRNSGVQWLFESWSHNRSKSHTYKVPDHDVKLTATLYPQYRLSIDSPAGDPSGFGWYDQGSTAYFRVTTPYYTWDKKYIFDVWSGDYDGSTPSNPSGSTVMDTCKHLIALWETMYRLIIHSAYGNPVGSGYYPFGTSVQVSINKTVSMDQTRHLFSHWYGDYQGTDTLITILMDEPKEICAIWRTQHYLGIECDPPHGGSVNPSHPGRWYNKNEKVMIKAFPDTINAFQFSGWSSDHSGMMNPDTVLMDTSLHIIACFEQTTHVADFIDQTCTQESFRFHGNAPNPFNPSTNIRFELDQSLSVQLTIYNSIGRFIRHWDAGQLAPGSHCFMWNGTDQSLQPVPAGVYLYCLRIGKSRMWGKALLIK